MKKAIRSLAKTPFVRDAALLQAGAFVTMGLQFALSIVLARSLGASQLGLYTLILAAVTTLSAVLDAGQGYSMLTLFSEAYGRKDRKELTTVLRYYLLVTARWSVPLILLLIVACPSILPLFYRTEGISLWVQLGLASLLFTPVYEVTQLTLQGVRNIRTLTLTDILFGTLDGAIPLAFVIASPSITSVMLGRLAAAALKACTSLAFWRKHLGRDALLPSFGEIRAHREPSRKLFRLGFWIALNKQSSKLIGNVPYYLLGLAGDPLAAGRYKSLTSYLNISTLFSGTVSRLLGSVLPSIYASNHRKFRESFWKGNIGNMLASLALLVPLLVLGNAGLTLLYGAEYAVPPVIYPMMLVMGIDGITVGFGSYYRIHNAMHLAIINQLVSLAGGLAAWAVVAPGRPLVGIAAYMVASSVVSKIGHWVNFRILERRR